MSGYDYSDVLGDFDHENGQQNGSGLRAQLETVLEQNRKLIERLEKAERKGTTEALFKEKGIDPAAADMIPAGADAGEWLDKFGRFLGVTPAPVENDPAPTPEVQQVQVDPALAAEQAALERMNPGSDATGSTVTQQDPMQQLRDVKNEAELMALIDGAKGGERPRSLM